jgi:FKBP-type peptidyl-prolyl cis-trans isomerase
MHPRGFVSIVLLLGFLLALTPALMTAQETAPPPRPQAPPAPPDVAAPPADAVKTASGMYTKVVQAGTGTEKPGATDLVTVLYSGWTKDGRCFDSSALRGNKPSSFPLNNVLAGWSEGVQLMVKGEKRRLWVPEALAFKGAAGKPTGTVVFDIELVDFKPSPTAAPADVAAPPADAKKTGSGLAYKVITPGTGTKHPGHYSKVTVHYTGWTTDGKMFDSSVARGTPATFGLDQVIKGWTEGVQLMVEGEKTRFWIPKNLAYGDSASGNQPKGMLVFDIELIAIDK